MKPLPRCFFFVAHCHHQGFAVSATGTKGASGGLSYSVGIGCEICEFCQMDFLRASIDRSLHEMSKSHLPLNPGMSACICLSLPAYRPWARSMACGEKRQKLVGKITKRGKESNFKSGVHLDGRFVYRIKPNKRSFVCSMQEDRKNGQLSIRPVTGLAQA